MKKKHLIILIGNIGSGKSTYCKKYQEQGYIVIARDQLRYGIGNGKYVFNYKYEPVIWSTELYMFRKFIELEENIVVDEVGMSKNMRQRYIPYAKENGYTITALELPRLSMGESVTRRMINPHGQPNVELWKQVWTKFEAIYEPPTKEEGFDKIIKLEKKDVK